MLNKILLACVYAFSLLVFVNCSKPASFSVDEQSKEITLASSAVFKKSEISNNSAVGGQAAVAINPISVCGPQNSLLHAKNPDQSVLSSNSQLIAALYFIRPSIASAADTRKPKSIVELWDGNNDSLRDSLLSGKPFQLKLSNTLSAGVYSLVVYDKSIGSVPELYAYNQQPKAIAPVGDSYLNMVDPSSTFEINAAGVQVSAQNANVFVGFTNNKNANCSMNIDPLVLQLNKQPIQLTSENNGIFFDMLGNWNHHAPVRVSWFTKANDDLYVLTLPNHGRVDGINELFGNATYGPDRRYARDGFAALAKFDLNKDNVIDEKDAVFSELRLWNDKNLDGQAQPEELFAMSDLGVLSIDLRYDPRFQESDQHGNLIKYKSVVKLKNNHTGLIYDLWLKYRN